MSEELTIEECYELLGLKGPISLNMIKKAYANKI